ncbi:MAG TPA: class I SAM-dependent methyltransferase [Chloroflexota bacterium]|nr:class I SAM-dependent methyltransferase [Chloroflexota bacterium]
MSFDRVADIYDTTRAMPEDVVERIADRIVAATAATADTRFLELGIGTGRIALPLIRRGFSYTGVDISERMTARLLQKIQATGKTVELVHADITDLPFDDGSFDVVVVVHVLHLVPEWRRVLDEVRRVLAPSGLFVLGSEKGAQGERESAGSAIRRHWQQLVTELGATLRPDYGTWANVERALVDMGCRMAVYRPARWNEELRPIDLLEEQRNRTFSMSWTVPDDVLLAAHTRMVEWVRETYGDPGKVLTDVEEFMLLVSRFPDGAAAG